MNLLLSLSLTFQPKLTNKNPNTKEPKWKTKKMFKTIYISIYFRRKAERCWSKFCMHEKLNIKYQICTHNVAMICVTIRIQNESIHLQYEVFHRTNSHNRLKKKGHIKWYTCLYVTIHQFEWCAFLLKCLKKYLSVALRTDQIIYMRIGFRPVNVIYSLASTTNDLQNDCHQGIFSSIGMGNWKDFAMLNKLISVPKTWSPHWNVMANSPKTAFIFFHSNRTSNKCWKSLKIVLYITENNLPNVLRTHLFI